MKYKTFLRRPFEIEAVKITNENIEEVAELIGEVRKRPDGSRYILTDKRLLPGMERVYIGFYLTRMGRNIRCYGKRVFEEQFVEKTSEKMTFEAP